MLRSARKKWESQELWFGVACPTGNVRGYGGSLAKLIEIPTNTQMLIFCRIEQPVHLCMKWWTKNQNLWSSSCAMMIWVTPGKTFPVFVFVFCALKSAVNLEIEL